MTTPDGYQSAYIPSLGLPRRVTDSVWWGGGCSDIYAWGERWRNEPIHRHQYCCAYYVMGSEKTLMVETGHGAQWPTIEAQMEAVLGDRKLDYVFPTHHEIPHAGNLARILDKYPEAVAVGDVTDYHLYFPGIDRARLVGTTAGDGLDLGDRSIEFLKPVFNDLSCTLWAYETTDRLLFCADGLEYSHLHGPESCGLMSDEIDLPADEIRSVLVFVIQPYVNNTPMAPALDALWRLFERLRPVAIGPSHGAPIRGNLDLFIPWILEEYAATGSDRDMLGDVRVRWQELLASAG